jgi:hypothetical protein
VVTIAVVTFVIVENVRLVQNLASEHALVEKQVRFIRNHTVDDFAIALGSVVQC